MYEFDFERALTLEAQKGYIDWLSSVEHWNSFWTLTFKDPITQEGAEKKLRQLLRYVNEKMFGKRYRKYVGFSYFSLCLFQRTGD